MFNPADFDALIAHLEKRCAESGATKDVKAAGAKLISAVSKTRRLAKSLGMMAPEPSNGYPFCPAPGCNRSQEPGLDYCAAHYELDADDMPNVFEPAPVHLCHECGAAPANAPLSNACEACYVIALDELAQEAAAIVDASNDALEIVV